MYFYTVVQPENMCPFSYYGMSGQIFEVKYYKDDMLWPLILIS